jgi:MYXO-CTERM domain-containing protein
LLATEADDTSLSPSSSTAFGTPRIAFLAPAMIISPAGRLSRRSRRYAFHRPTRQARQDQNPKSADRDLPSRRNRRERLKRRTPHSRRNWHDPRDLGWKEKERFMRRARWKLLVPTATLTVTHFAMSAPVAQAFFPPVSPPPGVVVVSPPVVPPVVIVPPTVVVPPVSPPPIVVVPPTSPPTSTTPEPSSLVAGLAGLTAAAGWAARRRQKTPK